MTPAFELIMELSPSLQAFEWPGEDPDQTLRLMFRRLRTASSGETLMILAAFSLIPQGWLPNDVSPPALHLSEIGSLDLGNAAALVAAVAVAASHPEAVELWR